jgi:hypothetical protein
MGEFFYYEDINKVENKLRTMIYIHNEVLISPSFWPKCVNLGLILFNIIGLVRSNKMELSSPT